MATAEAARALRREGEIGTIGEGMRADLLVLRADPEADIRNTRAIDRLFQGGVERRPADLLSGEP
jgi:imidazolonepropionase-like amidohydrolase